MELDTLRSIVTVASFGCFAAICAWAFSARAKPGFEEAARLPFAEDDLPPAQPAGPGKGQ